MNAILKVGDRITNGPDQWNLASAIFEPKVDIRFTVNNQRFNFLLQGHERPKDSEYRTKFILWGFDRRDEDSKLIQIAYSTKTKTGFITKTGGRIIVLFTDELIEKIGNEISSRIIL